MTNLIVGQGVVTAGEHVYIHVDELVDEKVKELLAETQDVADKRGLSSEGAAQVAVARSDLVIPELLVATLDESGAWYTKVANELNDGREKRNRVLIVPEDELPGRAEAWVSEERQKAVEGGLSYDEAEPVLLLAVPNTPVSHAETVQTWANARGGQLWQWGGRIAFLKNWPDDLLSGYNPGETEEPVRFVAIETGYDEERSGTKLDQLHGLNEARIALSVGIRTLRPASLFEGGILANRYSGQANPGWRYTYVRQIELQPHDKCVPDAVVDVGGYASGGRSRVEGSAVSRRLVA